MGLPDPNESPREEKKREKNNDARKERTKRTVALREDTFLRLRAISFWLMREERMTRATVDDVVKMGIEALLEGEPELCSYVEALIL